MNKWIIGVAVIVVLVLLAALLFSALNPKEPTPEEVFAKFMRASEFRGHHT